MRFNKVLVDKSQAPCGEPACGATVDNHRFYPQYKATTKSCSGLKRTVLYTVSTRLV